ncbi:MAG TPA: NAD-dependent epimerase/dehydratase family protein [Bacillus bacterium]|nr:NAD-dependent epimerase/dehydratase family protein [Bacillus sp. (in: firmicutes)]
MEFFITYYGRERVILVNILVTGGAGYIGSHTCVALLEAGHLVILLKVFIFIT